MGFYEQVQLYYLATSTLQPTTWSMPSDRLSPAVVASATIPAVPEKALVYSTLLDRQRL